MKTKILLFIFLLPILCHAQEDSTEINLKNGYKWKNAPFYARASPFGIYTGPGKYADRIPQYVEIGKTFNLIDAGIAAGRYNLRPDSTFFLQAKINMDLGNLGIFANETTVGAGKLFDGHGSLMLELTYNVMAQVSNIGVWVLLQAFMILVMRSLGLIIPFSPFKLAMDCNVPMKVALRP